jgi:5,10-methylenetetrahydrofolate reductase
MMFFLTQFFFNIYMLSFFRQDVITTKLANNCLLI